MIFNISKNVEMQKFAVLCLMLRNLLMRPVIIIYICILGNVRNVSVAIVCEST